MDDTVFSSTMLSYNDDGLLDKIQVRGEHKGWTKVATLTTQDNGYSWHDEQGNTWAVWRSACDCKFSKRQCDHPSYYAKLLELNV